MESLGAAVFWEMLGFLAVGGTVGAVLNKEHRVLGTVGGAAAGFGAFWLMAQINNSRNQALVKPDNQTPTAPPAP